MGSEIAGERFVRRRFRVPRGRHDEVCAALAQAGFLGAELDEEWLDAWYEADAGLEQSCVAACGALGAELVDEARSGDQDWLASYRREVEPIAVGRGFEVDAGEQASAEPVALGRRRLRLPARRAFGTGSHESTRLAVEWLERLPLAELRVLDVGSGSGILSFVAERLGARFTVGVECDLEAALLGGENRRLNGSVVSLVAAAQEVLAEGACFDVVVANILPQYLDPLLVELSGRLAPRGRMVVSGCLASERQASRRAFERADLHVLGELGEGEWWSWLLAAEGAC
jgi:ribosomal protein L11 methyltransferase